MHLRSATTLCWLPVKTSLFCLAVHFLSCTMPGLTCSGHATLYMHAEMDGNGWADGRVESLCVLPYLHLECKSCDALQCGMSPSKKYALLIANMVVLLKICSYSPPTIHLAHIAGLPRLLSCMLYSSSITSDSQTPASLTGQQSAAGQTALYENVGPHDALWTFDMKACTWQKRHATGDLPEPHLANALAVVNSKVYALVNDPEGTRRLEVYELDLETCMWRRVPPLGTQPSCRRATSAVVTQVGLIANGTQSILETR